jgi:hypothetical protein
MAAVWIQRKRYVGVMYGVTLEQIEKEHGGLAVLAPTNVIGINNIDDYFDELSARVKDASHV